ncbi:two-component sensor histidine kinase [Arenicella chitinivorans]|uniref:histidine kinase n=1 Tax=Arenicella chitinivorans TaxID=1329800 RepID=A0A918RWV3_9GAMM|nr:ATP-binding protein [Arenicella chitinivorans]GHA15639.1 two-component sensor histidine kinase [Arenicella chitinivorans]
MYSLRHRLLISASFILLVFLGLMSVALSRAFEQSVISNAQDALRNQILLLIGNLEFEGGRVVMPTPLPEPRLSQAESSLFADIRDVDGEVLWQSRSLLGETLPVPSSQLGDFRFRRDLRWPSHPRLYQMTLGISWETAQGDIPLVVRVAEHAGIYQQRIDEYRQQLMLWLLVLGLALLGLLLGLFVWALKPLGRVIRQVGMIETGKRRRFDEDYPEEVNRLTQNLNQLLQHEEQRIEQQKEVLGNLAHSLKTPIAILSGLNYSRQNNAEVERQLNSMRTIIDYQLQSASAVGRTRFAKPLAVFDVSQDIMSSVQKLYVDKALMLEFSMPESMQFHGDKGDWMELLGNLADNACKWARQRVSVRIDTISSADHTRSQIQMVIEDDGPGIAPDLRDTILQRGVRLDSQTPGHGLGMHIVKGIVQAYGGELEIGDSRWGGAQISVRLP